MSFSFTPHIDTSHFVRINITNNVTVKPPPVIHNIPKLTFTPNITPSLINRHIPIINTTNITHITDFKNSIPNIPVPKPNHPIDDLKHTLSVCTPTPIIKTCFNISKDKNGVSTDISTHIDLDVVAYSVSESLNK